MGHYPLMVLSLVSLFYYVDRYIIYILIEPIRIDFNLTDGQIGVITGIAFGLTYTLFVLPVGIMSDRYSRVRLLAIFVVIWSSFTALCGLARSFVELVLLRAGVAAGEAGGGIPSQALVADFYPPKTRGRAFSAFLSTSHIGKFVAFAGAGYLADLVGWRMTFAVVGVLGLFLGPLLIFTLREPKRGASENENVEVLAAPPTREALSQLMLRRGYLLLVVGFALVSMALYSLIAWLPAYYIRRFDMETGDAGLLISLTVIVPTLVGMAIGGLLSDKLFEKHVSWVAYLPAIVLMIACPFMILQVHAPTLSLTILTGLVPALVMGMYAPPLIAAIHLTAGSRIRGTALAMLLIALNCVGQGFGPALSGLISDYFSAFNTTAEPFMSLRYSLSCISSLFILGGVVLCFAGPRIEADTESAREFDTDASDTDASIVPV